MIWVYIMVIMLLVGGAIALVVIGLRTIEEEDPLQTRLAEFAQRVDEGSAVSLEELELSQPLMERIILPIARRLGEIALRFTPQNALQSTAEKLERAGNPRGMDPTVFFALRFVGVGMGALMLVLTTIAPDYGYGQK